MKTFETIVTWAILCVSLIVWFVVGIFLWLPMLVRATAIFSATIIHSNMTGRRPDAMRGHLEAATGFYLRGFQLAFNAIRAEENGTSSASLHRPPLPLQAFLFPLLFWLVAGFLLAIFKAELILQIVSPVWERVPVLCKAVWGFSLNWMESHISLVLLVGGVGLLAGIFFVVLFQVTRK